MRTGVIWLFGILCLTPAFGQNINPVERFQVFPSPAESRPTESDTGLDSDPDRAARRIDLIYQEGFVLKPVDQKFVPFEFRFRGLLQPRFTYFGRDQLSWTDSAGVVRPIRERNDFEIERARFTLDGFFHDAKLGYFMNVDADTDDGHALTILDAWLSYEFVESVGAYIGKNRVPGSREWIYAAPLTRFADRSMVCTFFRPDRSIGVWIQGEPRENLYFQVMLANGFITGDLKPDQLDSKLAYAGSVWWDPLGEYGASYSDIEFHENFVARVGVSTAIGFERDLLGQPSESERFFRLSDGTLLIERGALTPGATVNAFDLQLLTVDAAFKYRGFSGNLEYYFRCIQGLRADAPLTVSSIFDHGFNAELGYFLVPKRLELGVRLGRIFGQYGNAGETGGGLSWYPTGTALWKWTLDAFWLDPSPTTNSGPNYRAGDVGLLVRAQVQVGF